MNISIFASVWCQNLWDELIVKNEVSLLEEEFWKEASFRIFSYDVSDTFFMQKNINYYEYFPIAFRRPENIFRNIRNFWNFIGSILWSDIVVIWWGWIIYDSELQSVRSPLDQWIFRTNIARLFWKKIYFYAVWIDIKEEENIKKLKNIFKKSWKITVRDEKSQKQLDDIWITSEIVDDPVMGEEKNKWNILWVHNSKNFKLKDFERYDFRWKRVWLALRSWYIWSSGDVRIESLLVKELCDYIEQKWGKLIFLPHSLHKTDARANDYKFMKQYINYDREIYATLGEVYTAYTHNMVDLVISMRLHSIILSHVYGIDQITLSYSQKTQEAIKKLSE